MCSNQPVQSAGSSTAQMLRAYAEHLPALNKVLNEQILPGLEAQLGAAKKITPEQTQLQYDLEKKFGPLFTELGLDRGRQGAVGQVGIDAAALDRARETGLVDKALAFEKQVDPEYYATRSKLAGGIGDLISSINPNALTGSEEQQISRSLARSGTGAPSAARSNLNAQVFGDKLNEKKKLFTNALNTASTALPQMKTNFDPYQVATGKSSRGNQTSPVTFAPGAFGGTAGATAPDPAGLFGQVNNYQQAFNASQDRRTGAEKGAAYATNAAAIAAAIYAMV